MKRTPLKRSQTPIVRKTPLRRSIKPIARSPIKKKSVSDQMAKRMDDLNMALLKENRSLVRKSIPDLLALAVKAFHAWVKRRDSNDQGQCVCISCGAIVSNSYADAGHYRAGTFSPTRFHELNVWLQCVICNRMKDGNEKAYRIRLVNKIGEEAVLEIEQLSRQSFKWSREYLIEIIHRYAA